MTARLPRLGLLNQREFRYFFAGTVSASISYWMHQFVIGWLSVQLAVEEGHPERGALYVGLTGLVRLVPTLGLGIFGGVAADRFDRRRMLIAARSTSALALMVAALLMNARLINMPLVLVLVVVLGTTFAFDMPARLSLTQELVGPGERFSALGIIRLTHQTSTILGPLVGGILVVSIGVSGVFGLNVFLYLLSALSLGKVRFVSSTRGRLGCHPAPSLPRWVVLHSPRAHRQILSDHHDGHGCIWELLHAAATRSRPRHLRPWRTRALVVGGGRRRWRCGWRRDRANNGKLVLARPCASR